METSLDWYNKWTIFLQTFNFEFILLYFANFNNLWLIILSERVSTSAARTGDHDVIKTIYNVFFDIWHTRNENLLFNSYSIFNSKAGIRIFLPKIDAVMGV